MHVSPLQPEPSAARKLKRAARLAAHHVRAPLPPVLLFTDPARPALLEPLASRLPNGWGLVYRHFGAPDAGETAMRLARIARQRKLRLLIGADPDLARLVGAAGVHWPERLIARAARPAGAVSLNTASAHGPSSVLGPQPAWIDARVLSAVFPSDSPSAGRAMGATRFRRICQAADLPVYGLGGVSAQNAGAIAGFAGLAGVSLQIDI